MVCKFGFGRKNSAIENSPVLTNVERAVEKCQNDENIHVASQSLVALLEWNRIDAIAGDSISINNSKDYLVSLLKTKGILLESDTALEQLAKELSNNSSE